MRSGGSSGWMAVVGVVMVGANWTAFRFHYPAPSWFPKVSYNGLSFTNSLTRTYNNVTQTMLVDSVLLCKVSVVWVEDGSMFSLFTFFRKKKSIIDSTLIHLFMNHFYFCQIIFTKTKIVTLLGIILNYFFVINGQ